MRHCLPVLILAVLAVLGCGPKSGSDNSCTECGDGCVDLGSDPQNCGGCGTVCDEASGEECIAGQCVGQADRCDPGAEEPCYSGAAGTEGVGPCTGGTRTCSKLGVWGACLGEVYPITEICDNGVDDDCDGTPDDIGDDDGDGWGPCSGDCCDIAGPGCADPALVNPGAFEIVGNDVDDDCDGVVDNQLADCDANLPSDASDPMQYARALDLCQTAEEDPPIEERRWGVLSAELVLADGSSAPASASRSIRPAFGGASNQRGGSMVVLSTGHAAAVGDTAPDYAAFQVGQDMGTSSAFPSDWLAANGGSVPNAPGCPAPAGDQANDPVMLVLRIRVPTNARSFSFGSYFYSAEYPEWVCSPYNDFFVALLDSTFSGQPANPGDGNLAIYTAPDDSKYPVGVNLAFGDTGLFTQCENGPTGCNQTAVDGTSTLCASTAELSGTGFDVVKPQAKGCAGCKGWCQSNDLAGGGTGWLLTSGNVEAGEVIELRLAIWDTSDAFFDSVVLLDNFQWSVDASEPGTDITVD